MKHSRKATFGLHLRWPFCLLILFILPVFWACSDKNNSLEPQIYDGPTSTLTDAVIWHSDSARIKAKIVAAKILNFQNEDREVPDGLYIEFYTLTGAIKATLKADYAYYTEELKRWKAQGNIIVHNVENDETLYTEELLWFPETADVSTKKFVKIERPGEIVTGTGLHAKQDFSTWTIDSPEGTFEIEDDGTN